MDRILRLMSALWKYQPTGAEKAADPDISFQISEADANEYLAYRLRTSPRPGIKAMSVRFSPDNRISAMIEVDFGAVAAWRTWSEGPQLAALLNGRRVLRFDVRVEVTDGLANLSLLEAYGPDGSRMDPKGVMGLIHSIGLEQPEAFNSGGPIKLPFALHRVWTREGLLGGET